MHRTLPVILALCMGTAWCADSSLDSTCARLALHVEKLELFSVTHAEFCEEGIEQLELHLASCVCRRQFTHELTLLLIRGLLQTRQIGLIARTWHAFMQELYMIDPVLFIREFAQIIIMMYHALVLDIQGTDLKKNSATESRESIEVLLEKLDALTHASALLQGGRGV